MNIPTLENKLYKSALLLAVVLLVLLILHDVFIINDYPSLILEALALFIVVFNLTMLRKRPASERQIFLFAVIFIVLINVGWHTGGGVNLLTVGVYFIAFGTIMMLIDTKYYRWIAIFVLIDILVFYFIEKAYDLEVFKKNLQIGKNQLERDYLYAFMLFFFGGALVAFIKINFNKERDKLHEANAELAQTKLALDQTVTNLRDQKEELEAIKENLEQKVEERTKDFAEVNERLVRKNQQLEQYGYIISHNLKAPVAQIKGLVHVLPNPEAFDPLTKETLVRLNDSAEHLEKVLSDLSTILRVEKNMQQSWENVDLAKVIEEIKESIKNNLEEKQVTFHCTNSDLPEITAIKAYVYSVLHNIIENAVKYTDLSKQDRFVKVSATESGTYHIITVMDNGLGIDMAAATGKLFQLYQRFNTTHPGQGIGLFLVKSQMEAMSGRVEMDSMLGHGTTFTLWFAKKP